MVRRGGGRATAAIVPAGRLRWGLLVGVETVNQYKGQQHRQRGQAGDHAGAEGHRGGAAGLRLRAIRWAGVPAEKAQAVPPVCRQNFKAATLAMITAQGGIVGWVAPAAGVIDALSR